MILLFYYLPISLLILIGIIHVYWGFGGRLFFDYSLPEYKLNYQPQFFKKQPGLVMCLLSAGAFFFLAACMIFYFNGVNSSLFGAFLKVAIVVLIARIIGERNCIGLFKREKSTKFAKMDNYVAIPICLFLVISLVIQFMYF